jgi:hypothetical protein
MSCVSGGKYADEFGQGDSLVVLVGRSVQLLAANRKKKVGLFFCLGLV